MLEVRGWLVDPTPDYAVGKYFARARLVRLYADAKSEPEMHIERDMGWFETPEEAIYAATEWAHKWIADRNALASGFPLPPEQSTEGSLSKPCANKWNWNGNA